MLGCSIIGSDLPYTYESVTPGATFNPFDESDMLACIRNICNGDTPPVSELLVSNQLTELLTLLTANEKPEGIKQ